MITVLAQGVTREVAGPGGMVLATSHSCGGVGNMLAGRGLGWL